LRYLLAFLLFFVHLNAEVLIPTFVYEGSGGATDMVYKDAMLYVATAEGTVDVYDTKAQKRIKIITVPKIKDFLGDEVTSKVFSVDVVKNKIMIVSQGEMGYRRVHIYKNGVLNKVISTKQSYTISKAKFIDENKLIIALLSNEVILYDIKNSKELYRVQISASKFSSFALNEKKDRLVLADESGDLELITVKDGKILKQFKGQNVDNIFQLDYKNGIIITAGQDRRTAIYSDDGRTAYYKEGSFLIYSAGLSPSGKIGAFASDENNNVTVFNTGSKADLATLGSHKATMTSILFINEKELFTASDDTHINYWKL